MKNIIFLILIFLVIGILAYNGIWTIREILKSRKAIQRYDVKGLSDIENAYYMTEPEYRTFTTKQKSDGKFWLGFAAVFAALAAYYLYWGNYIFLSFAPIVCVMAYQGLRRLMIGPVKGLIMLKCEVIEGKRWGNNFNSAFVLFYDFQMKKYRIKCFESYGHNDYIGNDEVYVVARPGTRKMRVYGLCAKEW